MTNELRDSNLNQLTSLNSWSIKAQKKPLVEPINYMKEKRESERQDV